MDSSANWVVISIALAQLCMGGALQAQDAASAGCGAVNGGAIRGVVVDDSTGATVSASWVYLFVRGNCRATADANGRFLLHAVAAGRHRIETGQRGYRQFRPIEVMVAAGDTTFIELRLRPGGPLEDCRVHPDCAALLEPPPESLPDEDAAFRVIAYGTAIALAWDGVARADHWYACLEDTSDDVFRVLAERYNPVVPAVQCQRPADLFRSTERQMRHLETGHFAFIPRVDKIQESNPELRLVSLSYYVGPLWGQGWDCEFERSDRNWRPRVCWPTWIA